MGNGEGGEFRNRVGEQEHCRKGRSIGHCGKKIKSEGKRLQDCGRDVEKQ